MPHYLALLRGINVSGKKIIKMEALRSLMEANGYANVTTHIQSGNVFFEHPEKSKPKLAEGLEAFFAEHYGFDVTVFVVDKKEVENAVANNPFAEGKEEEPSGFKKLYVTFMSGRPSNENMEKLKQSPIGEDEIEAVGEILYFKLASKASDSKLSNNLIESKLKLRATTRNWNVTLKLLQLLEAK